MIDSAVCEEVINNKYDHCLKRENQSLTFNLGIKNKAL